MVLTMFKLSSGKGTLYPRWDCEVTQLYDEVQVEGGILLSDVLVN